MRLLIPALLTPFLLAAPAAAQLTQDPFPPIDAGAGVITVTAAEFAVIPDEGGEPARMMHMTDEPGTKRLFVSSMRGGLYSVSYDGKTVRQYLDANDTRWGIGVQSQGSERGFQSFAFHPQFAERGAPGYGRFYTYVDTPDTAPTPDFVSGGEARTHDTVLLEWIAADASAAVYDGKGPRVLFRAAQPYGNHNGGEVAFNPLARPGDPEFGLLYVGSADGGSGGDPFNLSQNMTSAFGKILRIDPLGSNSANQQYGIPASNPFVGAGSKPGTLGEIYALGVRNPQRFTWDAKDGRMYVADIGQNAVEEVSPVTAGANLGWNTWEASYRYENRNVDPANPRSGAGMTWPVAEYDHHDPLFGRVAITGLYILRQTDVRALQDLMIFGDNPSGEIFYLQADTLQEGSQPALRRILLHDAGTAAGEGAAGRTFLEVIRAKNEAQGRKPAPRADLRFGRGSDGRLFLLNKHDGVVRVVGQ